MDKTRLQFVRCARDDAQRLTDLKTTLRRNVDQLLVEADAAGHHKVEAAMSLIEVARAAMEDLHLTDDQQPPKDPVAREDVIAKSALDL